MFDYIVNYNKDRVSHYKFDEEKTKKVKEIVGPELLENLKKSQTEFIKGLLAWFNTSKFFTWLDLPKC